MLDIAYELKKRKAGRIFTYATYATFTAGLESFDKAVADGVVNGVFGTNLTYRSPELLGRSWFHEVDVSKYLSLIHIFPVVQPCLKESAAYGIVFMPPVLLNMAGVGKRCCLWLGGTASFIF